MQNAQKQFALIFVSYHNIRKEYISWRDFQITFHYFTRSKIACLNPGDNINNLPEPTKNIHKCKRMYQTKPYAYFIGCTFYIKVSQLHLNWTVMVINLVMLTNKLAHKWCSSVRGVLQWSMQSLLPNWIFIYNLNICWNTEQHITRYTPDKVVEINRVFHILLCTIIKWQRCTISEELEELYHQNIRSRGIDFFYLPLPPGTTSITLPFRYVSMD